MSDKRIIEQTGSTEILNDDWFVKDSPTGGTTKIQGSKLLELLGGKVDDVQADEISFVDEDKVADLTPLAMIGTASGDIASFDEGSGLPFKSLVVNIEPQQDLHGYDSPWAGGAGKNKLGSSSYGGNYGKVVGDDLKTGTAQSYNITTDGTVTVESVAAWSGVLFVTPPLEAGSYSIPTQEISVPSGSNPRCGVYITDSNLIVKSAVSYKQYVGNYPQTDITVESGDRIAYGVSNAAANSSTTITNFYVAKTSDLPSGYTPYSNICPISGWDEANVTVVGKNLFVEDFDEYTLPDNYSICPVRLKKGSTYTITASKTGDTVSGCLLGIVKDGDRYSNFVGRQNIIDSAGVAYSPITITVDDTYTNPKIVFYGTATSFAQILANYEIMFNEGTATAYVPYNGHTYTIDLDGTRYGGTLDVVSGVLTVDRVGVDMATLNWTNSSSNHRSYCYGLEALIKIPSSQSTKSGCIAEKYFEIPSTGNLTNGEFAVNQSGDLIFYYDGVNPPSRQLVYPLATPLTIQLTPTQVNSLLGVNNIWADTGSIRNTEFIEDATTVINSLIASLTDLKTLEYSSYFIGGNTLEDEYTILCVYNEHLKHVQIDAHPHTVIGSGAVPRGNYVLTRVPFIPRYTTYIPINRADSGNINAVLKIRKTEYNNQDIGEISVELLDNNTPKGVELCTHLEFYYDDDSIIPSQS